MKIAALLLLMGCGLSNEINTNPERLKETLDLADAYCGGERGGVKLIKLNDRAAGHHLDQIYCNTWLRVEFNRKGDATHLSCMSDSCIK